MTTRLLVSGSRLLTEARHAVAVYEGLVWAGQLLGRDTVLVHGACPSATRRDRHGREELCEGLDELAARQWARWGLPVEPWPADWAGAGLRAGPDRNAAMVASLGTGPALCMVWPHPDPLEPSRGTWGLTRLALDADVTVLSGWTRLPVLSVPEQPAPATGRGGPYPHAGAR